MKNIENLSLGEIDNALNEIENNTLSIEKICTNEIKNSSFGNLQKTKKRKLHKL